MKIWIKGNEFSSISAAASYAGIPKTIAENRLKQLVAKYDNLEECFSKAHYPSWSNKAIQVNFPNQSFRSISESARFTGVKLNKAKLRLYRMSEKYGGYD